MSKIGYLSGPVDGRKVFQSWHSRVHTDLFGTSYLQHWFSELERQGRPGIVVTSHGREVYNESAGSFEIMNRPKPVSSGAQYFFDMMRWTHGCLNEMVNAGARTIVLTDAQHFWFVTRPFRKKGIRFVNSLHCTLRALQHRPFSPHEMMIRLSSAMHFSHGDPTMAISTRIIEELAKEPGSSRRVCFRIIPDYSEELFEPAMLVEQVGRRDHFVVLFAGRIEANKGVFDLLEVAERLRMRGGRKFRFDICGVGAAMPDLERAVAASSVSDSFVLHGFVAGADLAEKYAECDLAIVPTRSDFNEGFAKSVIEGVLAGRPVVTNLACPAIDVVGGACVEAEVDNPASYADAIWQLANDPELLREKVDAARGLRGMFFDPPERYDRQLRKALAVAEGRA